MKLAGKLTGVAPVLGVEDVAAAAAFVRDRLGFTLLGTWGDPPGFGILERDGVEIFVQVTCAPRPQSEDWSIYLRCPDAEALHRELVQRGAPIREGLTDKIYGAREFEIAGPENHIIVFGQNLGPGGTEEEQQP